MKSSTFFSRKVLMLVTLLCLPLSVTVLAVTIPSGDVTGNRTTGAGFGVPGSLGISTFAPAHKLHLKSTSTGTVRFRLENGSGIVDFGTGSGNLYMWTGGTVSQTILSTGETGIGRFPYANVALSVGSDGLKSDGDGYFEGTMSAAIVEIRGGADLAESFKVNNPVDAVQAGMVVSIDPEHPGEMKLSSSSHDRKVGGIISGAGGLRVAIHLGDKPDAKDGFRQVALTGRVYVKATATSGAIQPGDMLTTSSIPGHAMKVTDYNKAQGAIIGKAMTTINPETGLVLVLVTLQ